MQETEAPSILLLGLYPDRMTRLIKTRKTLEKQWKVESISVARCLKWLSDVPAGKYLAWWVSACLDAARLRPRLLYYFNVPEVLVPGVLAAKAISRAEVAVDVRSAWIPIMRDRKASSPVLFLAGILERSIFSRAAMLTAPNTRLRRYAMSRGVDPSIPSLLVPNFADIEVFNREVKAIQSPGPVVAFSGSLFIKEGIDLLIEAMELIPWAQLWIFGDGPERNRLERLARERLGMRFRFWGHKRQNELARYLIAADVCVIPLKPREATSYSSPDSVLKFAEYACLGKRIVTTDVGLMGESEAYVARPHPDELAEAIRLAFNSPRKIQPKRYSWSRREEAVLRFFRARLRSGKQNAGPSDGGATEDSP